MTRLKIGFLAGVITMYFFDPGSGAERRRRWADWWGRNRGDVEAAARNAASIARQMADACQEVARTAAGAGARVRERLTR
jgi:hypothetical protein